MWYLLQQNEKIVAIRRPSSNVQALHTIFSFYSPEPDKFLERIDWRIVDILDINSIRAALCEVTTIYHCAAMVSLGGNSDTYVYTNIMGTKNIVTAALEAKVGKFCFVSSIAACGKEIKTEIDANATWTDHPARSFYSKSKYESEQEVWKRNQPGIESCESTSVIDARGTGGRRQDLLAGTPCPSRRRPLGAGPHFDRARHASQRPGRVTTAGGDAGTAKELCRVVITEGCLKISK